MRCNGVMDRLLRSPGDERNPTLLAHLDGCPACRRFQLRLQETRQDLRRHHAGVEPDGSFALRLRHRLEGESQQIMGRTALRLLPLSAALLLLLLWMSAGTPARQAIPTSEETEQAYISWVLQGPSGENS